MTLAILLIIAAVLSLAVVVGVVSASRSLLRRGTLSSTIAPVDIEAFRNLMNPAEEEYLRRKLPAGEFRCVQRKRLLAAAAYVQAVGQNAALLVHIGQSATNSADAATSAAARQLVEDALLLRHNAAVAMLRIRLARVWPAAGLAVAPIADSYSRLSTSAMLLGRLQSPATAVRIATPR